MDHRCTELDSSEVIGESRHEAMNVFLSYSFRQEDRELVAKVERLLTSQNVKALTGKRLGGAGLTDEVLARIERCDALVALLTKRDQIGDPSAGRWATHPWVLDELNHARAKGQPTIPLVECGVELGGAYGSQERIELDSDDPGEALVALSETIALWKEQVGLARRVQLKPDSIGQQFRSTPGMTCQYRFVSPTGERTAWRAAPDPIAQASGTVVFLEGVADDDHYIEIEIKNGDDMEWYSTATAQLISVDMIQAP
jgi:hypothetical protein